MKVDGIRRNVGDVITLRGAVTKLREAENAERAHEMAAVKLRFESRRLAKQSLPSLAIAVAEAERALVMAQGDLDKAKAEQVRVQALTRAPHRTDGGES